MKLPVYLIIKPTGLFTKEGVELVVPIAVKLSKSAAEDMAKVNPGSRVEKLVADKE